MAAAVTRARVRIWRQEYRWKKDHNARGPFGQVYAGQVEELRLPVFDHPCEVGQCKAVAPFGVNGAYYCREHLPK